MSYNKSLKKNILKKRTQNRVAKGPSTGGRRIQEDVSEIVQYSDEFKIQLGRLEATVDELQSIYNNATKIVNEYCDKLKSQVEVGLRKLNKEKDQDSMVTIILSLFETIEDYRDKLMLNIDIRNIKHYPDTIVSDTRSLINQWSRVERNIATATTRDKDRVLVRTIRAINLTLENLQHEIKKATRIIFGESLYIYEPPDRLFKSGWWVVDDFKKTRLDNSLPDPLDPKDAPVYISCITTGLYFYVGLKKTRNQFLNTEYTPCYGVYSSTKNKLLDEKMLGIDVDTFKNVPIAIKTFGYDIVLAIPQPKKKLVILQLIRFDGVDLTAVAVHSFYTTYFKEKIALDEYIIGGISIDDEYITICFNFKEYSPIVVFDRKFKQVKTFGQREKPGGKPLFFPIGVKWFDQSSSTYLIQTNIAYFIIDKKSGFEISARSLENLDNPLLLSAENGRFIIVYIKDTQFYLKKINEKGESIFAAELVGMVHHVKPCVDAYGNITFIDLENKVLLEKS